jgi:hypothetical protein
MEDDGESVSRLEWNFARASRLVNRSPNECK